MMAGPFYFDAANKRGPLQGGKPVSITREQFEECCCEDVEPCEHCDAGTTPEEIAVTVAGMAAGSSVPCADCANLDDTYVIGRPDAEGAPCLYEETFLADICGWPDAPLLVRIEIRDDEVYGYLQVFYGTLRFDAWYSAALAAPYDCAFDGLVLSLVQRLTAYCLLPDSITISAV